MPGKRRSIDDFPTPTLAEFEALLKKAEARPYREGEEHLAIRDAALLAFEFLYKCRISEIVGMDWGQKGTEYYDSYEGIKRKDITVVTGLLDKKPHLRVHYRLLKRGFNKLVCPSCKEPAALSKKFCGSCGASLAGAEIDYRKEPEYVDANIPMEHQLMPYILRWLEWLDSHGCQPEDKVFNINRIRAWIIMRELGIMNHTQRHWRASQLSEVLDPYDLQATLRRKTIPTEYVHRGEWRRLAREKAADELWKE